MTSERFRGTRVRGADSAEMRESYELRTMLEVRSVRLAAPYSEKLLADLDECLVEMDAAVSVNDSERYIDAALRFHRRMVEGSQNRTFLSVWDSLLWDIRGRIALRRLAETGRSFHSLAGEHRELLGRLRAQDAEGAARQVHYILDARRLGIQARIGALAHDRQDAGRAMMSAMAVADELFPSVGGSRS